MTNEILVKCISKGFLLDKALLEFLESSEDVDGIIEKIVGLESGERIVTKKFFDEKFSLCEVIVDSPQLMAPGVKVLKNVGFRPKKLEVADFVGCFQNRYEILKGILGKEEFEGLSSIRKIGVERGRYVIIAAVMSRRVTKNKNLLVEVEDMTGSIKVLINQNKSNLFAKAGRLLDDDIVAFVVSGNKDILFVDDIVYPEVSLEKRREGTGEGYVAFAGDFHVGSKRFLKSNLLRFVRWINGEEGDARSKGIASNVKYLLLTGDNVDGVSHYPGQEKDLDEKTFGEQYRIFVDILKQIRSDVQVVICPGQHDAVWLGEPQPAIGKKFVGELYEMGNVSLVSNPAMIEVDGGFKILMYHGASINRFIDEIPMLRAKYGHDSPTKVVEEILRRRHLAPVYGLMDFIPIKEKDNLVIDEVPDIIATADQHRAEVGYFNNVLMVASSCWQATTAFEERMGINADPCKVPLFDLGSREIKIIDFSGGEVKWDDSEDLVCKLEVKDE